MCFLISRYSKHYQVQLASSQQAPAPSASEKVVELIREWKEEKLIFQTKKHNQKTHTTTSTLNNMFLKAKMKIITLGLATSPYVKEPELDRGVWSPHATQWKGALGSGLAAPSPHPSSEEGVLPKTLTVREGEGFLGKILLQHQAGSPCISAGPHGALCSHIRGFPPM